MWHRGCSRGRGRVTLRAFSNDVRCVCQSGDGDGLVARSFDLRKSQTRVPRGVHFAFCDATKERAHAEQKKRLLTGRKGKPGRKEGRKVERGRSGVDLFLFFFARRDDERERERIMSGRRHTSVSFVRAAGFSLPPPPPSPSFPAARTSHVTIRNCRRQCQFRLSLSLSAPSSRRSM